MTRDDFRRQADAVRSIPLETVLTRWGAERDRRDRSQWRTERGPLSVTGAKFFNWHLREGGGGAIDLVMHLGGWDADTAVQWLQQHLVLTLPPPLWLPALPRTLARGELLPVVTLKPTRQAQRRATPSSPGESRPPRAGASLSYRAAWSGGRHPRAADRRGKSVCRRARQRGLSDGGRKAQSSDWRRVAWHRSAYLAWTGARHAQGRRLLLGRRAGSQKIVLCESAIDAISCFQLHRTQLHEQCICISTAGVRPDAPWLQPLLARGYDIHCGFDDDEPGNTVASQMITRHPSIKRLRPPAHDWNDALACRPLPDDNQPWRADNLLLKGADHRDAARLPRHPCSRNG